MFNLTQVILFGAWTLLALLFLSASLVTTALNWKELSRRAPFYYLLTTLLLIPAAFCVAGSHLAGTAWTLYPAFLFPLLCLLAAWLHFHALREAPLLIKFLSLPVFCFDILLGAVWAIQLLHLAWGIDLGGDLMSTMTAGVLMQHTVGHPEALFLPVLVHLPLLLPPFRVWGRPGGLLTMLAAAAPAACMLGLWVYYMPAANRIATSYRADYPPGEIRLRSDQRILLRHGPGDWSTDFAGCREADRKLLEKAGAGGVLLMAPGEILEDERALAALVEEARWARSRKLEVAVAALPATAWLDGDPGLESLAEKMKALHWTLAVKVAPRLLVLWWEPVLLGVERLPVNPPLALWIKLIRKCSEDIEAGFPEILTSVCIGSTGKEGRRLFAALAASDFPLDRPGFTVVPFLYDRQEFDSWMSHIDRWIAAAGSGKKYAVLRAGTSPPAVGGEPGQAAAIAMVLRWAAGNRSITRICIHSLRGYDEDLGLVNPRGRPRPAFDLLRSP